MYEFDGSSLKVTKVGERGSRDAGSQSEGPAPAARKAPVCQVAGCGRDLSEFKEYLQRYRICEYHRTLKCLVKDGVHQRFCQQCGKFQPLEEFDADKRTCRRKLDRHNARRRKRRAKHGSARGHGLDSDEDEDEDEEEEESHSSGAARSYNTSKSSRSAHQHAPPQLAPQRTSMRPTRRSQRVQHAVVAQAAAEALAAAAAQSSRATSSGSPTVVKARAPPKARTSSAASPAASPAATATPAAPAPTAAAAPADTAAATTLGPLAGMLRTMARGGSVPQSDLDALLAPMTDSDMQAAVDALFGGSESTNAAFGLTAFRSASLHAMLQQPASHTVRADSLARLLSAGSAGLSLADMDIDFGQQLGYVGQPPASGHLPTVFEQGPASPGGTVVSQDAAAAGAHVSLAAAPSSHGLLGPQLHSATLTETSSNSSAPGVTAALLQPLLHAQQQQQQTKLQLQQQQQRHFQQQQQQQQQLHLAVGVVQQDSTATSPFAALAHGMSLPLPLPAGSLPLPAGSLPLPGASLPLPGEPDEFEAVLSKLFSEDNDDTGTGAGAGSASIPLPLAPSLGLSAPLGYAVGAAAPAAPAAFLPARATQPAAVPGDSQSTRVDCYSAQASQGHPSRVFDSAAATGWSAPLGPAGPLGAPAAPSAALQSAMGMLACAQAPLAAPQDRFVRMSLKMYNMTPEGLAPQLHGEVLNAMRAPDTLMDGFLRPGCVHLTLNTLLDPPSLAQLTGRGVRDVLETLLAQPSMEQLAKSPMLVQLGDELAVVEGGRVLQVVSMPGSEGITPCITSIQPAALSVAGGAEADTIVVRGRNIVGPHHKLLARHQGRYPLVEILATSAPRPSRRCGPSLAGMPPQLAGIMEEEREQQQELEMQDVPADNQAASEAGEEEGEEEEEWIEFRLPERPVGLVEVEVVRGAFLSGARPLLLLPCARAAAELRTLEASTAGVADPDGLLECIGLVLRYLQVAAQRGEGALSAADVARVTAAARTAVVIAAFRGWPAVLRLVLPALALERSAEASVAAMDSACPPGQTLLHTAMASGNLELLQLLGVWGQKVGHRWRVTAPGAAGVTPLHLAALLRNEHLLQALWELDPSGCKQAWGTARAADGCTPAQYASFAKAAQVADAQRAQQAQQQRQSSPGQQHAQQYSQLVDAVQLLSVSPGQQAQGQPSMAVPASAARPSLVNLEASGSGSAPAAGLDMLAEAAAVTEEMTQHAAKGMTNEVTKEELARLEAIAACKTARASSSAAAFLEDAMIQQCVEAVELEKPLKPRARRPEQGADGAGGQVPGWVTRAWTQDDSTLVASLREGLDDSAQEQVEALLQNF